MSRISALTPERMNPEQRKVYEESVARGLPTGGPYTAYIRIPQFMALNREMSNYLRSNSLPGRLRQMIVLRTIKNWGAKFPWVVQVRNSLKEGLEQSIIDAIDKAISRLLTPDRLKGLIMMGYGQDKENGSSSRYGISAANDNHLLCDDDAACMHIRKLVSGLSRVKRDRRYLMIIQLFLDESGYGQTDPHEAFIFAGFFGGVRQWELFAVKWDELLKEPPALTAKGFKSLLRRERNSWRVANFVQVLHECGVYRISLCIPRHAYEKAVLSELPKWQSRGLP